MKPTIRITDNETEISDSEARKMLKNGKAVYGLMDGDGDFATRVTKVGTKFVTTISGEEIYSEFIRLFKTSEAETP